MSTTFNVIPTKVDSSLTFRSVMTLAEKTISDYLRSISVKTVIKLNVDLHDQRERYITEVSLDNVFIWKDTEYLWLSINNVNGGIDAYCQPIANDLSYWNTYLEDTLTSVGLTEDLKQQIISCKYQWHFRRSAGQLPITNITFGHLAAAVAKLTDGFLYSNDGAWHHDDYPLKAEQFLGTYFYPDKAKHQEDYDWATRNIQLLKETLASQ